MTNLEQLKKEVREEWKIRLAQIAHTGKDCEDDYRSLDTLIDHIHAATVERCVRAMPKVDQQTDTPAGVDYELAQFHYKNEAISRLQALITEPV